ncbi:MAG: hypothetical protein NC427_04175 [Ruminococcus flavefaciens]|nr:hypothetical protein [Ruminococcus flavefaciens]
MSFGEMKQMQLDYPEFGSENRDDIGRHIEDMSATDGEKKFDPDKRAELSTASETGEEKKFDPDKRTELLTVSETGREKKFDPDKRVESPSIPESSFKAIGAEIHEILKNKQDGLDREKEVGEELEKQYPPEKGYQIIREAYLRNKDGDIVKDDKTDTARRIDYVVVKDGKVVDSIEVTSKTADKFEQTAKEDRIRDAGGNYVKDKNGNLAEMPSTVHTRIERRE